MATGIAVGGLLLAVAAIVVLRPGLLRRSSPQSVSSASTNSPAAASAQRHPIPLADERLGLKVYDRLREDRSNFVFSPYSIATALRMLGAGARGETAEELAALLMNPPDDPNVHAEARELRRLFYESRQGSVTLNIGNGLWLLESERLRDSYSQLLRSNYDAHIEFFRSPSQAMGSINRWVSDQTSNMLPQAFEPGGWNPNWRFVMVNAVHFKAQWKFRFDRTATRQVTFHLNGGRSRDVEMMTQSSTLLLAHFPEGSVLELPYAAQDFQMLIVLPKAVDGLSAVENLMLQGALNGWINGLRRDDVTVFLPRFRSEIDLDLKPLISALGSTTMFDPMQANFSGISPQKGPLWIDAARHQAFLKVDEEGTEAAAMTSFMMTRGGGPHPIVFRADHPFLFVLVHRPTGERLFLGRIIEPD